MSADLAITVNGEPMRLPAGASVADLLERLRVSTPRVAVERNREILPKAEYPGRRSPTATSSRSWSWSAGIAAPSCLREGGSILVFSAPRVGR